MSASGTDIINAERPVGSIFVAGKIAVNDILKLVPVIQPIGGQYLLDPNEVNGWAIRGISDDLHTVDLGNVGDANFSRLSGGLMFPFDVKIKRMKIYHRNSNASAQAWGWVLYQQVKTGGSNDRTTTIMLDESFDRGTGQINLRDYGNTNNQVTDVIDFDNDIITAGTIITLGVGSPTANNTNYYVQVMSGYLEFERVF